MGLQAALAGAQLIGGILSKPKKYGSAADMAAGRAALTNEAGIGSEFGSLAKGALNNYSADNAGYRSAVTDETNYLKADPFTDTRDAADLAQATRGTTQAFQRGDANLTASLARRGFDPTSSMAAGGLASLAGQEAATVAGAENDQAYRKIATRNNNRNALMSILSGESATDYGRGVSALGNENSIDSSLAHTHLGLGQQEQAQEAAAEAARNQQIYGGATGLGASLFPGAKAAAPVAAAAAEATPGVAAAGMSPNGQTDWEALLKMIQKSQGTPLYQTPDYTQL